MKQQPNFDSYDTIRSAIVTAIENGPGNFEEIIAEMICCSPVRRLEITPAPRMDHDQYMAGLHQNA